MYVMSLDCVRPFLFVLHVFQDLKGSFYFTLDDLNLCVDTFGRELIRAWEHLRPEEVLL